MATLTNISITTADDGYQLRLEDDEGGSFEAAATFEQLDLLSEEVDRILNANEEQELSVDDGTEADQEGAGDLKTSQNGSKGLTTQPI